MELAAIQAELLDLLPALGGLAGGACLFFLLTLCLTACSIPGTIIPMSLTGGLVLGPWLAIGAVAGGASVGSLLLFMGTRRLGGERLNARFGAALAPHQPRLARYGPFAVAALRVVGAPGPLITAGAALTSMRGAAFSAATLAGILPSVTLAAAGPGMLF